MPVREKVRSDQAAHPRTETPMAKRARKYWLMKSEPDVFGIEDLKKVASEPWDGVRNYQARNYMRVMQEGDLVLFYHSNSKPSGVAGIARIAGEARPDPTQFDKKSKYHDAKSKQEEPRWDLVDVEFVEAFDEVVSLAAMKEDKKLEGMLVVRKGMCLSVMSVDKVHFKRLLKLGGAALKVF